MSRSRWSSADGFTLVELLASLAVLALLSLLLVEGMSGRSLAWTRMDRDTATGETTEAVQGLLADRVAHIWPLTIFYIRPPGPDFDGRVAQVVFLAPPPEAQGPGPLRRYRLSLDAGGDLDLDSLSDLSLDPERWSTRQVLLQGVQTLDLAYFGAAGPDHAPRWRTEWRQQPFMPALVRIRVAFADGDRRRWPDLIIRPMADIDTNCGLVIATGGCRAR